MEQKNETTNLKSKRTNSNSSSHMTFSSENQKIQLQQFDFSLNRQYCSNVQHQQKIRCSKPVYDNKENMIFDRQKPNVSESSSHTMKTKYNNKQIEPSRNEWKF
jgi:hypothetical protein